LNSIQSESPSYTLEAWL